MMTTRNTLQATALSLCLLSASLAQAATPTGTGTLDKRLMPIADAAERHVEAPLMRAALSRQAAHLNTPFDARWDATGKVQVYLHLTPGSTGPGTQALTALGATGIRQSRELGVIEAWVPAAALNSATKLQGITRVTLPRYALHRKAPTLGPVALTGSVDTQGDNLLGAASFRSQTGINGSGITLGVISDGDDSISESQATGDLPSNIWNDPNDAGGSNGFSAASSGDEGTAMMEIVYDLAPGVKRLGFCGPQTDVDFITCLDDFASDISANIIVDDLAFPGGAMFTTDTFTSGVQSFATAHPGIHLVAATGNDGTGYWQGTWTPESVSTTVNGVSYTLANNFGSAPYLQLTVPAGDTIAYILQWSDPWDDNATVNDPNDYDVVVFDNPNGLSGGSSAGQKAVACNQGINVGPTSPTTVCNQSNSQPLNTPGPTPVQGSEWKAVKSGGLSSSTYYLEVLQRSGDGSPAPNLKILVFDVTEPEQVLVNPRTAGSVYGHAALAAPTEISAGAINAQLASPGNLAFIEAYSSEGPVESGVTGEIMQSIPKPDFSAPDCVSVTGAGGFPSPFCGTSAAAPHIAGLVALLMQGYPNQDPYTLLQDAASQPDPGASSGSPPFNGSYGYGVPVLTSLLTQSIFPVPAASISSPSEGAKLVIGQPFSFVSSCTTASSHTLQPSWDFGGSGAASSTAQDPSVTFNTAGNYTFTLTCTDTAGTGNTGVGTTTVDVSVVPAIPVAAISAPVNGVSIPVGQATAFTSDCVGAGTITYSWDFGASGVAASVQQDPSVTFSTPGTFTITLTCANANGSGTANIGVTVTEAPPTTAISTPHTGASITVGQSTTFTSGCTGTGPISFAWDFGSSGVAASTQQDPAVTFATAGTYTVTLTCTNAGGSNTANISVTVKAASSGGGAPDLFSLGMLGLLAALRRRRLD